MNTLSKILTVVAAGMISAQAMAASQGSVGTQSTGSSDVSVTVSDLVRVSSVADIALTYSGGGDLVGSTQYCVFRNGGGGSYDVTLTTDQGAFEVASGSTGDTIPFTANVDDDTAPGGGETLSYNSPSASLTGSASGDCGGTDNAEVEVNFAETDLQAVTAANDYSATMTILVEPI